MRRFLPFLLTACLAVSSPLRSAAAETQWFEIRSDHFRILTDSSEKRGREVAMQLERMRSVFQKLLPAGTDAGEAPITVLALRNKRDFVELEPASYLGKNQLTLAGYFQRTEAHNYILLRLDADADHPYATMYHEYAHYTMRKADWLPLWLNEGLAQFYQNSQIHEKDVLLGEPSSDDILYLRQNRLVSPAVLFAVDHTSPYYHDEQKGSVFYAESWALTHYLIYADWGKPQNRLNTYVRLLQAKTDPAMAAPQAFGDLRKLQAEVERYVAQGQYKVLTMKAVTPVDPESLHAQPISATMADAVRADVLVYADRGPEAQALVEKVLQADPKNAQAHETMGSLKLHEGNMADARKWYGEAVELDSQSYFAHYYFAVASLEAGVDDTSQIEASLRTAIRLNPTFAPSYDALARVLMRNPEKKNDAHMMNVQAIALDPGNVNYRLNAAAVMINMQQYPAAEMILKQARHVAKTPDDLARIDQQLTSLGKIQSQTAAAPSVSSVSSGTGGTVTTTMFVKSVPSKAGDRVMVVTSSDGREYDLSESSAAATKNAETGAAAPSGIASTPAESSATASGAHHTVDGIIRDVNCVFPSKLTLTVTRPGNAPDVTLWTPNFFKLDISAVNYTPQGDMNPCTDLKDGKAKIEYTDATDGSNGVIVSIALRH